VQAVLPVANMSVVVKLDGFSRQPPLSTLNGGRKRLDSPSRYLALGTAAVEPLLSQLGSDSHYFQIQPRLAGTTFRFCLGTFADVRVRDRNVVGLAISVSGSSLLLTKCKGTASREEFATGVSAESFDGVTRMLVCWRWCTRL
jgi:hypothetical protein